MERRIKFSEKEAKQIEIGAELAIVKQDIKYLEQVLKRLYFKKNLLTDLYEGVISHE
jgi:hypothetical protein